MAKRILFLVLLIAFTGGSWYAWREYNRTAEPTSKMEAAETLEAGALLAAYASDENAANARFNGKVVLVTGTVREVSPPAGGMVTVVLETGDALAGVACEFTQAELPPSLGAGSTVRIKGQCTGLLMDVVLNRCTLVE